ncbi:GntR family transcriptional regulator [Leucothrix mucor]|uniref:GntR family transcriptional regulator n=1 Tax=Leucothrix mucor TaxID=45248 RepID=UPI0003B3CE6B|nr:GntR family transcriptional regulator [Leucothrix mucor]
MPKQTLDKSSTSLSKPIYDALKEDIITGKLAAGKPLRQDEIAKEHGVSKVPVREALLKLESDGFVVFRKNCGATVRELSIAEILHLMDIRVALECKALELAIPNLIQADLVEAKRILDEYTDEDSLSYWSKMNQRFHHLLYEPCGNVQLLEMIAEVQRKMGPTIRLLVTETTGLTRPQAEHRDILSACEANNVALGVELLKQHIETTKKETAAMLRRRDQ